MYYPRLLDQVTPSCVKTFEPSGIRSQDSMQGTIERINRSTGHGTILAEDGREFFFDVASLRGIAVEDVKLGMRVEFQPRSGDDMIDSVIIFSAEEAAKPASVYEATKDTAV